MAASNTQLDIPMWTKQTPTKAVIQTRKEDLEIPLWVKPTCPNNMDDYVSVVPLHSKWLLSAEFHCGGAFKAAGTTSEQEVSGTESTSFEDTSDKSTVADENITAEDARDENSGTELVSTPDSSSESNKTQVLVAALRDARLRACARRSSLSASRGSVPDDWQHPRTGDTAVGSKMEDIVATLRAARINAAMQRASKRATYGPFTITMFGLNGDCHEFCNLYAEMQVADLCDKVADRLGIPNFAVRLIHDGQVFHMSHQDTSLGMVGIKDGAQLMLAKQFGWAKPDIRRLAELERQWRGDSYQVEQH